MDRIKPGKSIRGMISMLIRHPNNAQKTIG